MSVQYQLRDRIAYVLLDRPDRLNAFDDGQIEALHDAMVRVREDPSVKAVVITGVGDTFSVGLDIDLLGRAFADPNYFREVLMRFRRVLLEVERAPVPVVAAVNGLARAGGFELLLSCDMAIVADDARIGDTHLAFGLLPGGGATARLPRRIGHQRARELLLTGRWLEPGEAVELGLAARAVPRDRLEDEVDALVARFRPLSRPALAATKAVLAETEAMSLEDALDEEISAFMRFLANEPTAREGYDAFVEKREPKWD